MPLLSGKIFKICGESRKFFRSGNVHQIADFVSSNNLDGIDIDWEYPSKPDNPGMGQKEDGALYLSFLQRLREALPRDKSLSIAIPASFWYLKAFPIEKMAQVVDYFVFMTYDLHGQWDYGNIWTGVYLLSHVDTREITSMFALLTHAGVSSSKVIMGVANYGRSFGMQDPGCWKPNGICKFTGPASGAPAGECTSTAGYLGLGEINQIKEKGGRVSYDSDSDSNIMLWGDRYWVAYTDKDINDRRENKYRDEWNTGGTVEWAIDLKTSLNRGRCDLTKIYNLDDVFNSYCSRLDLVLSLGERIFVFRERWGRYLRNKFGHGPVSASPYCEVVDSS